MVTAVKGDRGARGQTERGGHASSDMGRPLEGPKSSEGAGLALLGWEWEAVSQRSALRWQHGWEGPGEQAESSRWGGGGKGGEGENLGLILIPFT